MKHSIKKTVVRYFHLDDKEEKILLMPNNDSLVDNGYIFGLLNEVFVYFANIYFQSFENSNK
jgi:hypothetical protein